MNELITLPTSEQAHELAVILSSGMPALQALAYFFPDADEVNLLAISKVWLKAENVQQEILKLQGTAWQFMSLEEKIRYTLDKNYAEMAYFLYSHNYAELVGPEKTKADDCRRALEAKVAGMAGQLGSLGQFWEDLRLGKISLANERAAKSMPPFDGTAH